MGRTIGSSPPPLQADGSRLVFPEPMVRTGFFGWRTARDAVRVYLGLYEPGEHRLGEHLGAPRAVSRACRQGNPARVCPGRRGHRGARNRYFADLVAPRVRACLHEHGTSSCGLDTNYEISGIHRPRFWAERAWRARGGGSGRTPRACPPSDSSRETGSILRNRATAPKCDVGDSLRGRRSGNLPSNSGAGRARIPAGDGALIAAGPSLLPRLDSLVDSVSAAAFAMAVAAGGDNQNRSSLPPGFSISGRTASDRFRGFFIIAGHASAEIPLRQALCSVALSQTISEPPRPPF